MDRQLNDNQGTIAPAGPQGGKLLDRFRLLLQEKGWAPVMAEQHVEWVLRYILFHGKRHPRELGGAEARQYLDHVRATRGAKDQEQARAALLALYAELLDRPLELPKPKRLLEQVHEVMRGVEKGTFIFSRKDECPLVCGFR